MWYLKAAMEDTGHYLMHCPQFCTVRQTLLGQISGVGFDIANMSTKDLSCLLLYGKLNGSSYINRMILEATVSFIKSSKRFAQLFWGNNSQALLTFFVSSLLFLSGSC